MKFYQHRGGAQTKITNKTHTILLLIHLPYTRTEAPTFLNLTGILRAVLRIKINGLFLFFNAAASG